MIQSSFESRVLLVDDNEQNRYVLSRILLRAGLKVDQSATGYDALERVLSLPDLVILDVKLPDISGYEVCRRIKSNPLTASVAVLQISASFTSNESKIQALEGGADGYLTHPIDATVLTATVNSLLRLKQVEASARQSAQQWQATVDALSESLVLLNTENRVIRCNRAFREICGKDFKDIVGKNGEEILQETLGTNDFLATTYPSRHNTECQHDSRWFHITIDPVLSGKQRIGSIVVLADITERKLAEESLRNAEKLAATGRLAHTIAHEINNPLEALTNLIYLAQNSDMRDIQQYLNMAATELGRVAKITKQVLSFHRDTKTPVQLEFHDLVQSVLSLYAIQIEGKRIAVDYRRTSLPAIYGFPGELRQVLANLIGNAIDATPVDGKISLRVRASQHNGVPGIIFTVYARGAGIPPQIRKRILEPFFTTKELKGTGLGLWLAKSIVLKHHGNLRFHSSNLAGRSGTCFKVFLPIAQPAVSEEPAIANRHLG
ncbi:MAG TPA: ATP-binding protein [Candidatus Angelobacter sp.]|nr:ATP-binding protein [Candidatus Angelobacter sp.]